MFQRSHYRWFLPLLLSNLLWVAGYAQHPDPERVPGELIVQIQPEYSIDRLFPRDDEQNRRSGQFTVNRQLSDHANIYLLTFDEEVVSGKQLLKTLRENPVVAAVQFNHRISYRDIQPNDPLFANQWALKNDGSNGGTPGADCHATQAWELTTGGLTSQNDEIVIAVVDDGLSINHEDLADNMWKNADEIPHNHIDDDQNGLIDDYNGWDYYYQNDSIYPGYHGTPVASIIGAKGNNGIGVSGVNWDVKLMPVAAKVDEASAVEAYNYVLGFRIKYNATNGAEGAFVVAVNSSWGIDYGNPDSMPIWCSMYDTLGMHGILSVASTMNKNENVDQVGDMPSACPSPYLITVTNTNNQDVKVTQAAYGLISIDLGAPSEGSYAAYPNNTYNAFSGTSGATPVVTGAIGLMYSASCEDVMNDARTMPDSLARAMKRFILESVDEIPSLKGKTVSGGRINIYQAVVAAENYGTCQLAFVEPGGGKADQLGILKIYPNPATHYINIEYNNLETGNNQFIIANSMGQRVQVAEDYIKRPGLHDFYMDVSSLPKGVYFLYIANSIRQSPMHKIVVY